jgi:hypothetical protein
MLEKLVCRSGSEGTWPEQKGAAISRVCEYSRVRAGQRFAWELLLRSLFFFFNVLRNSLVGMIQKICWPLFFLLAGWLATS